MIKQLFVISVILGSIPVFGSSAAADVKTGAANVSANAAANGSVPTDVIQADVKAKASEASKDQPKASLQGTNMQFLVGDTAGLPAELQQIVLGYLSGGAFEKIQCLGAGCVFVLKQLRNGQIATGSSLFVVPEGGVNLVIWNYCSGTLKPVQLLEAGDSVPSVRQILELQDGRLAAGTNHGQVVIFDLKSKDPNKNATKIGDYVTAKKVDALEELRNGCLVARLTDRSVVTWNAQTGKCISKLEHQPHPHKISLGGTKEFEIDSNKITIRSIGTAKICEVLQAGESKVTAFQELSNNKLVAGNIDGEVYFWDQQRFRINRSVRSWLGQIFKERGSFIENFQELPDGRVAALAFSGVVSIWDPFTYEIVQTFETNYSVYSMLVLKSGQLLIGLHKGCELWAPKQPRELLQQANKQRQEQSDCCVQ